MAVDQKATSASWGEGMAPCPPPLDPPLSATVSNLCPQPKSSMINHLINDRLLDALPTVIQTSPQLINILHIILIDPLL